MRVSVGASFMLANFLLCKNVNNVTGILSSLPYLLLGFSKNFKDCSCSNSSLSSQVGIAEFPTAAVSICIKTLHCNTSKCIFIYLYLKQHYNISKCKHLYPITSSQHFLYKHKFVSIFNITVLSSVNICVQIKHTSNSKCKTR